MRVLFLNNFYYLRGGSERVLFEEMRMLREGGHDVAVYSRRHEKNEPSEFSRFFPAAMDTERLGVSFRALRTAGELIYSRPSRLGLREVIRRFQPDVAHAHNIYGRLSTSVLDELQAQQVPTVLTLHDFKYICPSYLLLNHGTVCERCKGSRFHNAVLTKCHKDSYLASALYTLETLFNHAFGKYKSVKYFITPSNFLREKFVEFGGSPEKLVHIPNFIDMHGLTQSTGMSGYALYVGRLSREKGVRTLLQAWRGMRTSTHLLVVGDGPDRNELERMAKDNSLSVSFKGYLQGRDLETSLANARVVIVPSEWYENAPLSVLEAFSHGKPVIGAGIGGIPEMIESGVNGYLFEPGNAEDLRAKLELILGLPSERIEEMGASARKTVARQFSATAHYDQLMQVYARAQGTA